jgi:hypothetical protein
MSIPPPQEGDTQSQTVTSGNSKPRKQGSLDGYDLQSLRLKAADPTLMEEPPVNFTIPVGLPSARSATYFRTLEGDQWQYGMYLIGDPDDFTELYLVDPDLFHSGEIADTQKFVYLAEFYTVVDMQGIPRIVPIKVITAEMNKTARMSITTKRALLEQAKKEWVRGEYSNKIGWRCIRAKSQPEVPEITYTSVIELIQLAFADKMANYRDHPVFRRYRGESADAGI